MAKRNIKIEFTDIFSAARAGTREDWKKDPVVQRLIREGAKFDHIVFDGFAGLGGVSDGFKEEGSYYVIACINHSPFAIASHQANHPETIHLLEDFASANLELVEYVVEEIRKRNPNVKVHGWFSVDCTNHSNAKGGMPRDADSRTLAEDIYRYIETFDFDVIWLENVKEFLIWGPMIPKVVAE